MQIKSQLYKITLLFSLFAFAPMHQLHAAKKEKAQQETSMWKSPAVIETVSGIVGTVVSAAALNWYVNSAGILGSFTGLFDYSQKWETLQLWAGGIAITAIIGFAVRMYLSRTQEEKN